MDWKTFKYQKWLEEDRDFDYKKYNEKLEQIVNNDINNGLEKMSDVLSISERPPWKPELFYNRDANSIQVILSDESYYGIWLTPQITLLISHDNKEIVGVEICGIKQLLEDNEEQINQNSSLMV